MFTNGASGNTPLHFKPAPNEELLDCPYDDHKVLKHRMLGHLLKCRRNYELMCEQTGQSLILIKCRYNPADEILGPEIVLHESSCSDREVISTHTIPYVRKPNAGEEEDDSDDEDEDRVPYEWTYVTRGIMEYSGRPIAGEGDEHSFNLVVPAARSTASTVEEDEEVKEPEDDDDDGTQEENEETLGAAGGFLMKMEPSPSKLSVSLRTRLKNRVILPIGSVEPEPPVKVENLKPPVFDESVPWSKEEDWEQQMYAMNVENEDFDPNLNFNQPALLLHYPPALSKSMRKEYLEGKREQLNITAQGRTLNHANFEYLSFELDEDYLQRMTTLIPPPPIEYKIKKSIPPPPPSDTSSVTSSTHRPLSSADNQSVSSFQSTPSLSVNMKHARIRRPSIGISSLAKFSTPSAVAVMGHLDTSASDNESCAVSIKIEGDDEGSSGSEIECEPGKEPEFFRYRSHLKTSILGENISTVENSNDSTSKKNESKTSKKPK